MKPPGARRPYARCPSAGLAVALVIACAETPPAQLPAPPPVHAIAALDDLPSLLPESADSVLTINLGRLRAAPFARPIVAALTEGDQTGRRARGFDEIADVDVWLFARVSAPGGGRATLEIARGRFDAGAVTSAFLTTFPTGKRTEFGATPGVTEANQGIAFLSPSVIVMGPAWAIRTVIGVRTGKVPSARSSPWLGELTASLAQAARRRDRIEAAPREPAADEQDQLVAGDDADAADERAKSDRQPPRAAVELFLRASNDTRAELREALGAEVDIERLGARLDVGAGAQVLLLASAPSPEAAQGFAEQLHDALGDLQGRPSVKAMGLAGVLGRASVAAKDRRVAVTLGLTAVERAAVAGKLGALGQLLSKRAAPPAE